MCFNRPHVDKKRLRLVCFINAALTLVLIGLGGYVRATGAGLACPDWPLCFGRVIPPSMADGVLQEWLHRAVATVVGLLTIYSVYLARQLRDELPKLQSLCWILLFLVVVQGVIGGLTVLMTLNPFIVTAHLGLGTIFFLALVAVGLTAFPKSDGSSTSAVSHDGYRMAILGLSILTFLQIVLGGFVGSSGASLSCPDFPFCMKDQTMFGVTGAQLVHMIHRGLGVLIFVATILALIGSFFIRGMKRGHMFGMVFLVFVQFNLGIVNVVMKLPIPVAVMHLVVAELLLVGFVVYYLRLGQRSPQQPVEVHGATDS